MEVGQFRRDLDTSIYYERVVEFDCCFGRRLEILRSDAVWRHLQFKQLWRDLDADDCAHHRMVRHRFVHDRKPPYCH